MNMETTIKEYIARNILFTGDRFDYDDDVSFMQEAIIDSLGVMDLLEFVQSEFSIAVRTDEVIPDNFDSVTCLSAFIRRKQVDHEMS